MKFSYKELLELKESAGELGEHETANVHHCKHGRNNDRCYVTNTGEAYLFYCHHCHKAGKLFNKLASYKKHISKQEAKLPNSYHMPSTIEKDVSLWPVEARIWPQQASLTRDQIEEVGMGWDERTGRVCIPVSFEGMYRGYVARRIRGNGPKYIARRNDATKFIYTKHAVDDGRVVIVEDILSCIKLYYCGINAVALQGTAIDDSLLNYLTSNYSVFDVWLDNDNPQVKMNQVKALKRLELFGECRIIKTDKDPKEYDKEEIEEWLRNEK